MRAASMCYLIFAMYIYMTLWLGGGELPNVVFIISDQHKKSALGCYGDLLVKTPNIDKLASEGTRLLNCYAAAPVCAMSRAAYITGMNPHENGAIYHKAPVKMKNGKEKRYGSGFLRGTGYVEGITTLGEMFRKNGYLTASPGKMHVHGELQKNVDPDHPEGNDLGFDETSLRYYTNFPRGHYADEVGEDTYLRYRQIKQYKNVEGLDQVNSYYKATLVERDEDNYDMVVARRAIEYIENRSLDKKNFFLHVGFEKPHPPFTTTQKYLDMYNPSDFTLPVSFGDWYDKGKYPWSPDWIHNGLPNHDPKRAQNVMASYYACITQVDDLVGRIIHSLEAGGLLENTIVIYTTDHGEHLYEHGLRGKHNMYEASVNVPFVIRYPKSIPQGVANDSLVSLIDLMPSFSELLGWDVPQNCTGESFYSLIKNQKSSQERMVYAEYRSGNYKAFPKQKDLPSRMVRSQDFKFVYTHGMVHQLYNVKRDQHELNNLALNIEYKQKVQDWCFQALGDWRFDKYYPMKVSIKDHRLIWDKYDFGDSYTVYYSKTNDVKTAIGIAYNIQGYSYEITDEGFYWILANPDFTRTTKRFPDTPVLVEEHTFQLPITDPVEYL